MASSKIYLPWESHDKISNELMKEIWFTMNWREFIEQLEFEASEKSIYPEYREEKQKRINEFYKFAEEF